MIDVTTVEERAAAERLAKIERALQPADLPVVWQPSPPTEDDYRAAREWRIWQAINAGTLDVDVHRSARLTLAQQAQLDERLAAARHRHQVAPLSTNVDVPELFHVRNGATETYQVPGWEPGLSITDDHASPYEFEPTGQFRPGGPRPVSNPVDRHSVTEWLREWGIIPSADGLVVLFKATAKDGRSTHGAVYRSGCVTIAHDYTTNRQRAGGIYVSPTSARAAWEGELGRHAMTWAVAVPVAGLLVGRKRGKVRVPWCYTIAGAR
ncbi:MAG: hypothetical protein AB7Q42_05970 [Acidimicrobiia bacterium]